VSRSLIVALAAGAAVAVAALAPGGAAAKPMGIIKPPMPGPMGVVKPVFGVKPPLGIKPPKPGPVVGVLPPKPFPGIIIPHHDHDHDSWWWRHHPRGPWVVEEGYPVDAPTVVTGPAAAVSGPAPVNGPCSCLTKTYLSDGSVQFADVCTKESAIATPDQLRAQSQ
jgi:hypothetical protein